MPDRFKATLARNPMGRMGKPEEVARRGGCSWPAPGASFITGANLILRRRPSPAG